MTSDEEGGPLLPEHEPVSMPELPATLTVHTAQQFKAIGDKTRLRILDIIKYEPVTAKQIGERLGIPPGTIGHHLQVLEAAGLAQVVARRLIHGIVAKYYARTARLFEFEFPPEVDPEKEMSLNMLTQARAELANALRANSALPAGCEVPIYNTGFPHARLSRERAQALEKRLSDLLYEFATGPADPDGQVYGLCTAFFLAPPYLQYTAFSAPSAEEEE